MGKTNTYIIDPFLPNKNYGFDFSVIEFAFSFLCNDLSLFRFRRAFACILYL